MADIYNQATWWRAVKPDAATDAVWDQEISRQGMTPIERAARAIAEQRCEDPDEIYDPALSGKKLARWRRYVPEVVAVIAAIREPSEGMVAAVDEPAAGYGEHIWSTMIDALLDEIAA